MNASARIKAGVAAGALIASLALAGCSSNNSTTSTGGTTAGTAAGTTAQAAGTTAKTGTTKKSAEGAAAGTVIVHDFSFTNTATVKAGQPVTFENHDDVKHEPTPGTPAAPGDAFAPVLLAAGESGTATIAQAGTYEYYCSIHEGMTGQIVVT